jgi:hypothetical protein
VLKIPFARREKVYRFGRKFIELAGLFPSTMKR